MYEIISKGTFTNVYYSRGVSRSRLVCAISPKGTKFVKTQTDRTKYDNLLELGEC
jgi:hypothetical protein